MKLFNEQKYLDEEFQRRGGPIGPLHGLPISVKDRINIKGRISSAGYIKWIDKIAENDALIIKNSKRSRCNYFCSYNSTTNSYAFGM